MAQPNSNSASYFSHDADMRNDIKIKALRKKFGHTGYAVWCFILETLTDSEGFVIDFSEVNQELLAADYDITVEQLRQIIDLSVKIGLLQLTDGNLYSEAHQRRFAQVIEKKERLRQSRSMGGKIGMRNRWGNRENSETQPDTVITPDKSVITDDNTVITSDNSDITPITNKTGKDKIRQDKIRENKIEIPYRDIIALWNSLCGDKLPKVKALNDTRRQKMRVRLSEGGCKTPDDMTAWARELFETVSQSSFLCGENNHNWTATFDWLFENPTNWVKVMEGNYSDNRGANKRRTGVENQLGVGEYMTQDGRRTYGSGKANIPLSAPPRPSERHQWSAESNTWIML